MNSKLPFWAKALICILVVELLGGLGGFLTSQSVKDWYVHLEKPPGTPPNWLFGPVWISLYAMIGLSFAILWQKGFDNTPARRARTLFIIQMALNVIWSPVFFGLHQPFIGLIIILGLWVATLLTILAFSKLSKTATFLLIPYLLWVSYASYLNAGIWYLNG